MRATKRSTSRSILAVVLAVAVWVTAGLPVCVAAGRGEGPAPAFPVRIELPEREPGLSQLQKLGIDLDGVFEGWARAYVIPEELDKLHRLGFTVTRLPLPKPDPRDLPKILHRPENGRIPSAYHTYATLTSDLQAVAAAHTDIARLSSAGQSVQGRELWVMQLSANPDLQVDEPELLYIGAMHGDEVVGKELLIELIHYLTDNYGTDPRVTNLVDGAEIWILPSMNPDGTELAQRYNANGYDLNRNFPDHFHDPVNTPAGRQTETGVIMGWVAAHSVNLAANMHGGVLVANYPWDGNPSNSSVFSPTAEPAQSTFLSISRTYADNNPAIYASHGGSFDHGVTNGAEWYAVIGGMQDWAYAWYGQFHVTLEVSTADWPSASQLPLFWDDNRESMLAYLERGLEGVRGVVTDSETGLPLAATVLMDADPFPTRTDPDVGDFHRVVLPGSYTLVVSAPGYESQTIPVAVAAGPAVRQDVALVPLGTDLQPVSARVEDGPAGDGWLEPGETADLAVTLRNVGSPATGVDARLVPTGWYADVLRQEATYPDIGTEAQGESDSPHYEVSLASDVPAGHKVGLALLWETNQRSGTSEPFFLDVGAPACGTVAATDVPLAIADLGVVTSNLTYGTGTEIVGIQVSVDLSHTYIQDLIVRLVSPSGTGVLLHNRTGGSANNIVGTYGLDLTPAESLSVLHGEPAAGTWRLEVSDKASGDSGTLNSWSVSICGAEPGGDTPEMRFREVTFGVEGTMLRWWTYPGLDSYRVYRATDPSSAAGFVDVTAEDGDPTDTWFEDSSAGALVYYLVTGVGPAGEGPLGHFEQ